jgi:hypothetical protein
MVGCLGKLHKSVKSLGDKYMQPNLNKDILLNRMSGGTYLHRLLTHDEVSSEESSRDESNANDQFYFYICVSCLYQDGINKRQQNYYVAVDPKAICPRCN